MPIPQNQIYAGMVARYCGTLWTIRQVNRLYFGRTLKTGDVFLADLETGRERRLGAVGLMKFAAKARRPKTTGGIR